MYYIGVDIGGTFTDCVLVDTDGNHRSSKALSTKGDPSDGVFDALGLLAAAEGISTEELLQKTVRFSHGTTIGTNAVLERRGARVGLLTTAGHKDTLAMMRGNGRVAGMPVESVYSVHGARLPKPLTVPGAILEVHERVDAQGDVVVPMDLEKVAATVSELVNDYGVDSLAIALLWSFVNPANEQAIKERVNKDHPDLFVSVSSEVSPRLGEYERTVATVMNGYVGPACSTYLDALSRRLKSSGLSEPMLVMQSNGGVLPSETAVKTSLGTIDSGPSGGLTGTASLAKSYGHQNVVATDMGGTSFDIGLVIDGRAQVADDNVIDQYRYRLAHLDVRTVACGGGTIARFDETTGSLRVGPESAGSEPGPASYGRGGTAPTVTDADVVLGLLRPAAFLDGRMPLDADAAHRAVGALATSLGLSVEDTAAGIVEINNMRAASLVRQQTLERGRDPRDFVLYAYGGAGPLHAFGYAAEIGVDEVVVPLGDGASTLSAYGIASGDVLSYHELERPMVSPFDESLLQAASDDAAASAQDVLHGAGVTEDITVEVTALMRFREQLMHSLEVRIELPLNKHSGHQLLTDFAEEYARRYGHGATELFKATEVFAFRARASVPSSIPAPNTLPGDNIGVIDGETCEVYWPTIREHHNTAVYGLGHLQEGAEIKGPALIELPHTTIAVPPQASAAVGQFGEIHLHLSGAASKENS